jgi:hypothetical protein
VRRREILDLLLEGMFAAVAQAVVEVNRTLWLPGRAPKQHAHHRCDADAPADQHCGHVRVGVDEEVPGWGLGAQDVTDLHVIVEVVRRQAGCVPGVIGWRRHALDRHPVVRRVGPIRKRVAARDRTRGPRPVCAARRDLQGKGEELPRLERWQRLAIDGLQVERALRLGLILERTLRDPELSPSHPRHVGLDGWRGRDRRQSAGIGRAMSPYGPADPRRQLQEQRGSEPGKKFGSSH